MLGCSTSTSAEFQDPNHCDAPADCSNISKTSDHSTLQHENVVDKGERQDDGNGNEDVPEEEDEDEDTDFNPSLKETNSLEASSSLSSEVEDLDMDVAHSRGKDCVTFDNKIENIGDIMKDCCSSGNVECGEEVVMQNTVSDTAYDSVTNKESALITQSENGSLFDKEDGPTSLTDVNNATNARNPTVDIDTEDAICMRTRARYSLASFTLDELETFLQETDDEDDLHNMEALYKKLYEKYSEEKERKESQFDELNRDQEVKFVKFVAAADEMMQYLKSENEKLSEQVDVLKSELTSSRASSEQLVQYQNLLMEEKQKNKELSEEISRLQKAESTDCSRCTMCKKMESGQETEESSHNTPGKEIKGKSGTEITKKRKIDHRIEGTSAPYIDVDYERPGDQPTFGDKSDGTPPIIQQPSYCQRKIYNSGGDATDTSSLNCMFQYLVEFVVGMKVTPSSQSNEISILVQHQSSGYTFSLTWITNLNGEVELLYRVSSIGTFERVAPEWMKETLLFSTSMCGVFFDRVSRVIKSYR